MTHDLLRMTSLAVGASAAAFVWFLLDVITREREDLGKDSFERGRRARLREGSRIYRWFEPLLEDLDRMGLVGDPANPVNVARCPEERQTDVSVDSFKFNSKTRRVSRH